MTTTMLFRNHAISRKNRSLLWHFKKSSFSNKNTSSTKDEPISMDGRHQQVEEMRQRMQQQQQQSSLSNKDDDDKNQGSAWDSLWEDGLTPWDLGMPTKALISEIRSKKKSFIQTAFVPGCGSGYDLISLARYMDEYDHHYLEGSGRRCVIGLEISPKSIERATSVILEESFSNINGPSKTPICLYHGDAFACPSTWELMYDSTSTTDSKNEMNESSLSSSWNGKLSKDIKFDFIFDYLFFCAIPPDLRPTWGYQMSHLLQQEDGHLLTLMFPYSTTRNNNNNKTLRGPPYPVSLQDYQDALHPHGLELLLDPPGGIYESEDTFPVRRGQEMVGWWSHQKKG
eukprot:scaffold675_cov103-Cylindrotheca_fusiformis.AAC.11